MKTIMMFILAVSALTACGPQQTSASKDQQQIDELVKQTRAKFAPLVGTYVGTLTTPEGEVIQVGLYLYPETQTVSNSGRAGVSDVPTIGGSLNFCITPNDKCYQGSRAKSNDDKYPAGQFNVGQFDPATNHLYLYFNGSPSVSTTGSTTIAGAAQMFLDGTVNGDEITGVVYTTLDPSPRNIDLKRVK